MRASIAQSVRCGFLAMLVGLSAASSVGAQSIIDARRVEFTPSPDHSALDVSGVALVDRYSLQVLVAGGTTVVETADLGKPAADPDGMIRIDFVARLASPLTPGVVYEALVEAVGPGGSSGGTRTNTFSFASTCAPSITPASQSFSAAAGTGNSTVTAGAGCAWTAASNVSWLSVTAGATGSGGGTVTFGVAANTATSSRTGTLTIAGKTFTVTQAAAAPCAFAISPSSQSFSAAAGIGNSTVTAAAGCAWTAASNVSWLSVTAGATGSGGGTVTFSVAARSATTSRTGTLTIAGKTFTVTQAGVACTFTVTPLSVLVGSKGLASGTITVTSQAGCTWSSASSAAWITVTGSGTGNGSATYAVLANTGTVARVGTLTIAGQTFTVNQGVKPRSPTNPRIIK